MVDVSTGSSTYVHRYTCVRVENKYKRGRVEGEGKKKERETEKEYPSVQRKCTVVLCSPRAIHLVPSPDIVKPSCNIKREPRLKRK